MQCFLLSIKIRVASFATLAVPCLLRALYVQYVCFVHSLCFALHTLCVLCFAHSLGALLAFAHSIFALLAFSHSIFALLAMFSLHILCAICLLCTLSVSVPYVCLAHSLCYVCFAHSLCHMFAARTPCASQNNVDISSQIYITKRILACIPSLNDLLQKEKNVLFRFSTMTHITHTINCISFSKNNWKTDAAHENRTYKI